MTATMTADSGATTNNDLLSVDDVVQRYRGKITKGTLANWRMKGDGPPFLKLGGRVLYPTSGLIAWEAKNLRNPG